MDIPKELPIIYPSKILIPGYGLKLLFKVKDNSNLLEYLNGNIKNLKTLFLGLIPKSDYGKVDNVIGTVGFVRNVILANPLQEEFYVIVQGLCRFKLGETITEEPLKMNKITVINNFKDLIGCKKENIELLFEFEKVFIEMLTFSDGGIKNAISIKNIEILFKSLPLDQVVEYCLKEFIHLSIADAYKVLRATDMNCLLKFVIDWFKHKTISKEFIDKYARFEETGLVPMPMAPVTEYSPRVPISLKKRLSPELKELQDAIENSCMPIPVNDLITKEFQRLQGMPTSMADYSILLNYVSYVVNLPWNKRTRDTLDLKKAQKILKLSHYGMDKVKQRILEFIAVKILNPERRGSILCFVGPPGVGKTTIARAIADSLNRNFKRISLGGINSFSDIKGHRKTYIGAMPGCVIQAINQVQTNNPIILLDEIDKMFRGSSGDPAAALLEVLDPEQNNSFVDSYIGLPFDLSQVMFIATANDAFKIPYTLYDRMEIIYLEGYTFEEKMQIAENYLIPKILKGLNIDKAKIIFNNDAIKTIIQNYAVEAGVRELQRKLEAVCQYIALKIVTNTNDGMKNYVITPESLFDILGDEIFSFKSSLVEQLEQCDQVGIAIGLYWTPVGGRAQVIETSRCYPKNESSRLVLTGLAGQTLKESVQLALNWINSFINQNKLDINVFCVHVHLPEGASKKDGPSAGITITCALVSLFWGIPLRPMIAMTGEISLQGYVLPVGGVKTKILAAYNSDITTVIIPQLNLKDINTLPQTVKDNMNIITVTHLKEVLDIVVPGGTEYLCNPSATLARSKL